jgi:pSer/pThr/pTyr-binding forkhead associated (FHA) protein
VQTAGQHAVLVDEDVGTEYPLMDAMCVVGRGPNCSVRIKHPALSRYHALIKCVDDDWTIADMKSTNGVYVNGRRIHAAALKPNDLIGIGEHTLIFKLPTLGRSFPDTERQSSTLPDIEELRNG